VDAAFHESDDSLELYALGRLSDSEVEQIEEHLFLCDSCRDRMDNVGVFALAMREELGTQPAPAATKGFNWNFLNSMQPRFALAGALAAVVLALGILWMSGGVRLAPSASLQLQAMRGDMKSVGVARELELTLSDAPRSGGPFRLEIVDASGGSVWTGAPELKAAGLGVRVANRLSPGVYFARLYSASGQLVHEYGFRVQG
jgi:hypothetical protein